jgi:hypothetical protein
MNEPRRSAEPVRRLAAAFLTVAMGVAMASGTGCQRGDSQMAGGTGKTPGGANLTSAKEVLDAMVAAYKKAQKYSDHGILRLAVTVSGEKQERTAPYSVDRKSVV